MKRRAPLAGLLALTITISVNLPASSESLSSYLNKVPGATSVDLRQAEIEKRIREAVQAGRLGQNQSKDFSRELEKIADLEAAYRASHGKLSLWENLKLLYQLDSLSRQLEQSLDDRQVADFDTASRISEMDARIKDGLSSRRLTEQEASGFKYELDRIDSLYKLLLSSNNSLSDAGALQLALDIDRLSSRLESTMHDRQIELPEIDKAQDEIAGRIATALSKGKLTEEDAKDLKAEFEKIADREATLKSYGRPLTSQESLALAVDLEKLSRELDLQLRDEDSESQDYKEKSETLANKIASGVVTGKLTISEALYLKDRLDKLSIKEGAWKKSGGKLSADERKSLLLDLEKLVITVERRLYDKRFSWIGASKSIALMQTRLEEGRDSGRIDKAELSNLVKELDKIKANWEAIRSKADEEGYPLKDSVYLVSSIEELTADISDSLRDRDVVIPELEQRKNAIDRRIAIGVVSGKLTADEGQKLLDLFDRISEKEAVYRASEKELSDRERLSLALLVEKHSSQVERGIHEGSKFNEGFDLFKQKLSDDIEEGIIAGSLTEDEAEKMKNELVRIKTSEKSFRGASNDLTATQALTIAQDLKSLRDVIDSQLNDAQIALPDIEKSKTELLALISKGVTSGKLSDQDAQLLRKEFSVVEDFEKKYSKNGGMSLGEASAVAYKYARLASRLEESMKDDRITLPSLTALQNQIDSRLAKGIASGALDLDRVKDFKERLESIARMEMGFRYTGDGLSYPESMIMTRQLEDLNNQLDTVLAGKSPAFNGIEDRIDKVGKRVADGIVNKKLSQDVANGLKSELDRISSAKVAFAHSEGGYSLDETETLVRDIDRLNSEIDLHLKGQKFAWSDIDRRQSSLEKNLKQAIASGKVKASDAKLLNEQLENIKRAKAAFTLSEGNLNYFERVSLGEALDRFNQTMKRTIK